MNLRTETKEKKEYVLFILDKSGSMQTISRETLNGVNEQIQELRKTAGEIKTFVSLVTFDSKVNFLRWNEPLETFNDIKSEEYVPDGMTAMLDAVGQSVSRLKNEVNDKEDDTSFLVIIVSDGAENSSGEYSWEQVATIISEAKAKKNWTITYMGANQDLSIVTKKMNIDLGNITTWTTTTDGTNAAYLNMSGCLSNYRSARTMFCAVAMDNSNFYASSTTGNPVPPPTIANN